MKKQNPLPITSFVEDEFEVGRQGKQKKAAQQLRRVFSAPPGLFHQFMRLMRRGISVPPDLVQRLIILGIRIGMALIALVLAFWLYALVDSFIAEQQFRRYHRPMEFIPFAGAMLKDTVMPEDT